MQDFAGFAHSVIAWQRNHGRHALPWQNTRDPYRVWLSEIMLQQTQVATVLGYYERFLARFPTVAELAAASQDDVLALWSGLGYYSRARNLHRCAQQVMTEHGGVFPPTAAQLARLPGIGRSTANAIAAFCHGERVAILDANVRRVLSRVLAFEKDLAKAAHVQELWACATVLLPTDDLPRAMPAYTQGMMDLGAQLCTPRKPQCLLCPVQRMCRASQRQEPTRYPVQTRKLKRTAKVWWLLLARRGDGSIWLEKRPSTGIWAGLYAPPVFESQAALMQYAATLHAQSPQALPGFTHVLTHMDLQLRPVLADVDEGRAALAAQADAACNAGAMEETGAIGGNSSDNPGKWLPLTAEALAQTGLPAPVRALLGQLA